MQRLPHYVLRLDAENPRPLIDEDEGYEDGSYEDPNLRAKLLDNGTWVFYLASQSGLVLNTAYTVGEHIKECHLPCSVVEYLMAEHLFGLFMLDGDGSPLSKEECQNRILIELNRLGYTPTTKPV